MTPAPDSFDIASLHRAYAAGADPATVLQESLRRIDATNDPGIFLHIAEPELLSAAARALGPFDPQRYPLWGVPFAVKDNIDVAGMPTTAACPAFAYEADGDAFCVARLRAAGAIPVGKTNLDQFATGLVGLRTPYPAPRNAADASLVPGGSSSGSAVAVARGIVGFALGTDTAGSGRVPAALNNIVGLKPTLGAVSTSGVVPACRTLDTVSLFALTVDDAHTAFRAAAGFDPADAYARRVAAPAPAALPPVLRVGVPSAATREFFGDAQQADAFEAALGTLEALGGEIVELDFTTFYEIARMLYDGAWVAERYAAVEPLLRAQPDALHPVTREIIARAERFSAADAFRGFYRLQALRRQAEELIDGIDMLCVPTVPTLYRVDEVLASPVELNSRLGTYTNFVNLLDLCGIALPTTPRADGWPGSATLLARAGQDDRLVALAAALHRRSGVGLGATAQPVPSPSEQAPGLCSHEVALAVVGAHMSGLPLNGELTRHGGRFLRAGRTAPCYRLYALAGGPPYRPGLVRSSSGAAIALELWALPRESLGALLQGIPAPLGLGSVRLEDDSEVTGFLCETAGLDGAEDITGHGGWRRYLAASGTG